MRTVEKNAAAGRPKSAAVTRNSVLWLQLCAAVLQVAVCNICDLNQFVNRNSGHEIASRDDGSPAPCYTQGGALLASSEEPYSCH